MFVKVSKDTDKRLFVCIVYTSGEIRRFRNDYHYYLLV